MRANALAAVAVTLCLGCSHNPPTVPVSGKILYQGKPLPYGTVMFQHESGGQPSRGSIESDGTFQLSTYKLGDGARPGVNLVRVACFEGSDPNYKSNAPEGEIVLGKSLIPRKYNSFGSSGLRVEVAPEGAQEFELVLEE